MEVSYEAPLGRNLLNFSEEVRIGGTLVWYAKICLRQVWLMTRCIEPDERTEELILGRLVDQTSYERERHGVEFGHNRLDIFTEAGTSLVVSEIKKSSRAQDASRLQLQHYLYELRKVGIEAKGELRFPRERRREKVLLDSSAIQELEEIYRSIREVAVSPFPPAAVWIKYCGRCAYIEYCWG